MADWEQQLDEPPEVHEVAGPAFTPVEAGATIAIGVISLVLAGVQALLLGAMVDEHRLTAPDIGLSAMLEALSMGATTFIVGIVVPPKRLRLITIVAALALTACDFATSRASGTSVLAIRAVAGLPEGVLFWITIAMIARTLTPERWAGVFITMITLAQFAASAATGALILPRYGASGGFISMATTCLLAVPVALFLPREYGPLPDAGGVSFPLPFRGWVSLAAILALTAAWGAVGIYLVPLAHQAGHGMGVASLSNALSLAAQVAGGALAVGVAGRVKYFPVLVFGGVVNIAVFTVYGFASPAFLFVAATTLLGFVGVFTNPFFVPMTIDADPSRRTAVQNGAVQILGGALGPLLASRVVSDANARGSILLGGGLIVVGTALVAWLRLTHRTVEA
ncbi:MAG TPA: MFS transporter [Caulobacteraceae bacterium]|nr:MFS transporter [Caulobacteraceae bacterium]